MCKHSSHTYRWCLSVFILTVSLSAATAQAQYRVLYSFQGGLSDGAFPVGSLALSGNTLYSTTFYGGGVGNDGGTIFQYGLSGGNESVIHSFGSGPGAYPAATPTISGNILYSTTGSGNGDIVKYNLSSGAESEVYAFGSKSGDGISPSGWLILSGNNLYGTTASGGSHGGGTIFQYNSSTGVESPLYSFPSGSDPNGPLTISGTILYGVTFGGGTANDGTIFQYNLSTGSESTVYSFKGNGSDGSGGNGPLILLGNSLYGTTSYGGSSGDGTIFQYNLSTSSESLLHSFAGGAGGFIPYTLVLVGDTLYGETEYGGHSGGYQGAGEGVIFSYDLDSGNYNVVHTFAGGTSDGAEPESGLTLVGDTLFGMTTSGGTGTGLGTGLYPWTTAGGVIFSVTVPEPTSVGLSSISVAALLCRRHRAKRA